MNGSGLSVCVSLSGEWAQAIRLYSDKYEIAVTMQEEIQHLLQRDWRAVVAGQVIPGARSGVSCCPSSLPLPVPSFVLVTTM